MPCHLPPLPANTRPTLVALQRPCVFTVSLLVALVSLLASAVFSLTRLAPPTCPRQVCGGDGEPRTRPRPLPPTPPRSPTPEPVEQPEPTAFASFSSLVGSAFRTSTRPPPARRPSARKFLVHELDQLTEAREEEELAEQEEERARHQQRRSPSPDHAPALTPDGGSDADSDGASEVDTLEDEQGPVAAVKEGGKGKGLTVLTGFRFRRTPSTSSRGKKESSSPTTSSPADEHPASPSSTASSVSSASSFLSKPCPVQQLLRPRSATHAGTTRPCFPSSRQAAPPRRQFSDPSPPSPDDFGHAPSSPTASSTSSTASSTLALDSGYSSASSATSSSAPTPSAGRKRSVTTLFTRTPFRSLSPLSRSPAGSPDPSPPPSPTLASAPTAAPQNTQRRGRSSVPQQVQRVPSLQGRVSSGIGADLSGASGLSLGDVLRR
ncbi:hypothetical protein JCM10207_003029 [Rhodosporidiobolus poonsookiae]